MINKRKFSFSTQTVPTGNSGTVRFQSQCRSGGGGNGKCGGGGKSSGKSSK